MGGWIRAGPSRARRAQQILDRNPRLKTYAHPTPASHRGGGAMRCRWSLGLAILVLLLHRSRAWLGHDWFGSSIGDGDDVAALWARSNASASELAVAEKNATDLQAAAMSSAERARDAEASAGRSWVVQQVLGSTSTQSPPCLLMMMIDWLMGTAPSVLFSQARALRACRVAAFG